MEKMIQFDDDTEKIKAYGSSPSPFNDDVDDDNRHADTDAEVLGGVGDTAVIQGEVIISQTAPLVKRKRAA